MAPFPETPIDQRGLAPTRERLRGLDSRVGLLSTEDSTALGQLSGLFSALCSRGIVTVDGTKVSTTFP
jgi:hypothetical protein